MTDDFIERPVVIAALVVLLAILTIEGAAVLATYREPEAPRTPAKSLINYIVEHAS
jgi:hypothetical protein